MRKDPAVLHLQGQQEFPLIFCSKVSCGWSLDFFFPLTAKRCFNFPPGQLWMPEVWIKDCWTIHSQNPCTFKWFSKTLWGWWALQKRIITTYYMIPSWRRQWHPTPVLLPGKSHGRRSLEGCRPWGRWGSDTTEQLHFHFWLSCIGEGNGNPLQCSCLENPRDRGAWWAAFYGVTQSWTRLKQLSSSSTELMSVMQHPKTSTCLLQGLCSLCPEIFM